MSFKAIIICVIVALGCSANSKADPTTAMEMLNMGCD